MKLQLRHSVLKFQTNTGTRKLNTVDTKRNQMESTETAYLDSYFDSVFSSQAVFPPPKFFLAVSANPYKKYQRNVTT